MVYHHFLEDPCDSYTDILQGCGIGAGASEESLKAVGKSSSANHNKAIYQSCAYFLCRDVLHNLGADSISHTTPYRKMLRRLEGAIWVFGVFQSFWHSAATDTNIPTPISQIQHFTRCQNGTFFRILKRDSQDPYGYRNMVTSLMFFPGLRNMTFFS